jgi:predicted DsbA family dithiol-disulfide isomerase
MSVPAQRQGKIEITYYTDPLCCWSWAMEQHRERLSANFKDAITWRYCMSGLLPNWKRYHDHLNSVSRPAQMAPLWLQAARETGVPVYHQLWIKDPPASSYPACVAVKCASLQSFEAGERFLYLLREACMVHGRNIAKYNVLADVAHTMQKDISMFDVEKFGADMNNGNGIEAFRKDLEEVKYRNINRFPTFIIRTSTGKALLLTGYRPYDSMKKVVAGLCN